MPGLNINGNVLTYAGKTYEWENGRNLKKITDGDNTYSYTYDENGIRTSKTVNGVTTYYNTKDGVILSQTDGTNTMHFQYDINGIPFGFMYNGKQYFYATNQFGDVLTIFDNSGREVATYEYDESGQVIDLQGKDTEIAKANPIRYRGYYYDTETGYYYLQSRYYDPDISRFINADVSVVAQISKDIPAGINSFAYCNNDPVNNSDPSGYISKIDAVIAIVVFAVYYVAGVHLKDKNGKYKFEAKKVLVDSMGNYIVKIVYYKNKFYKKSFILALGDKKSWKKATNINNHLNMSFINNQAKYIQSEFSKGTTTSLTNKGPDVYGINVASATVAMHLISQRQKVNDIKKYYNKVYGKKGLNKNGKKLYYLFNVTKGGNLNGWYAYNVSDGKIPKQI